MKKYDTTTKEIKILNSQSGQRIDNFLINYFKSVPKNLIYKMLRKGTIKVNKKRKKPFYKIENKDLIKIPSLKIKKNKISSINLKNFVNLNKKIIYEDDYIIGMNKPSGIAVHGGSGIKYGIIEALRILRPELKFLDLVHRLDKDTSGILLIAKKFSSLRDLNIQLFEKKIKKTYIALVHGIWPKSISNIELPLISKNNKDNKTVYVDKLGKLSKTLFKIKKLYNEDVTLMRIIPITGRTHQIRVHVSYKGFPIVNDKKYGNKELDKKIKIINNRLFLHAESISFKHPNNKKFITIKSPIDNILKKSLIFLNEKIII